MITPRQRLGLELVLGIASIAFVGTLSLTLAVATRVVALEGHVATLRTQLSITPGDVYRRVDIGLRRLEWLMQAQHPTIVPLVLPEALTVPRWPLPIEELPGLPPLHGVLDDRDPSTQESPP